MLVPVFVEDFASPNFLYSKYGEYIELHARIWEGAPEQQYYPHAWQTELDPDDLIAYSYSTEAGSDIMTMLVEDDPVLQSQAPPGVVYKVIDFEPDTLTMEDGFSNARDFKLRAREFWTLRRFRNGVFRIRTKFPEGNALWPAFWLYKSHASGGNGDEIDIIEFEGDRVNVIPTNAHIIPTGDSVMVSFYDTIQVAQDLTADFHDIFLLWLPNNGTTDSLFWFFEDDQTSIRAIEIPKLDMTMHLLFNFAVGGSPFVGDYTPNVGSPPTIDLTHLTFPLEWEIDEISVHEVFECGINVYNNYLGLEKDDPVVTGNVLILGGNTATDKFIVPGEFSGWHGKYVDAIATHEIILKNGFHAEEGSTFHARTVPCTAPPQRLADPNAQPELYAEQIIQRARRQIGGGHRRGLRSQQPVGQVSAFGIYPNPNTGAFTLSSEQAMQRVQVLDGAGRLVQQLQGAGQNMLHIKDLRTGLYLVSIEMEDGSQHTERVVVN